MNFFRTGLVGWLLLAVAAGAELDDALIAAAKQHDAAAVARLLEQGANPNAASPTGETALHWATQGGDVAVAQRLLKAGTKVGANRYGVTPLIAACRRGDAAMIKLLLEADADVNGTTPDGRTPLMVAAQTGKPEAVRILLARGADPNARERSQSQTALMWAAAEGHVDAVQVLLGTGVDRHARSKSGFTAFLFAVRSGHSGVVQALLAAGISANETLIPDPKAPSGASALAVAVTNLHYELGALLLSAGADPNYTWQGRTVLHLLTWVSRPGAGSNDPAPEGSGTMDRAAFVRTLVKQGADVNRPMTSGRGGPRTVLNLRGATPFLLAARTADAELMRLLVELGADPLIPNSDGTTPLMVAAGIGVQSPGEDPGTESEVL
ncbi:MAG: ankyrin repeat domain-containing protein, partial [Opitutaceae bacterium]